MSGDIGDLAEMIRQGAPHLIRSDEQLERYTQELFWLTALPDPDAAQQEAIALLTLLIERCEAERYPIPHADPVDVMRLLLERNNPVATSFQN